MTKPLNKNIERFYFYTKNIGSIENRTNNYLYIIINKIIVLNNCLNCGKKVKRKRCTFCSNKCRGDYKLKINPFVEHEVKCEKCGIDFLVTERKNDKKDKYYCSRSCANTRKQKEETKKKIGESIKNVYLKDSTYKDRCRNNNEKVFKENGINYTKMEKICIGCGTNFFIDQCYTNRKFCTRNCYRENIKKLVNILNPNSGGYRGSSPQRGKNGWYKGEWYDSSWELAWAIYNLDHNIKFERNYEMFEYHYDNKKRKYIPDFKIDDSYIEIKGFETEKDKAKFEYFPHKLIILRRKELYSILKYVHKKYGRDFVKLYESVSFNKQKIKKSL